MRTAASLAYLLARSSDTLADSVEISADTRLDCMQKFLESVGEFASPPRWPVSLLNAIRDPQEKQLLENTADLFEWLRCLPASEAALVREVVSIIISGQQLDISSFPNVGKNHITTLPDEAALDDYTWRVAGCVGAFWTKLGFLTLGGKFSDAEEFKLLELGVTYGKGLQLVNILRDLPADLANARCYLPVSDPHNKDELLETHRLWTRRALDKIDAGFSYAKTMRSRRLRAATVLPAMIARETLERMNNADWNTLCARVKVPRSRVYLALLRAFTGC